MLILVIEDWNCNDRPQTNFLHIPLQLNRAVTSLFNEVLTNISAPIVSWCLLLCQLHLHRTSPTDLQEHYTSISSRKSPFRGLIKKKIYSLIVVTKFSRLSLTVQSVHPYIDSLAAPQNKTNFISHHLHKVTAKLNL